MKFQVISQYHPAAALHNPRLWAVMLDDWENMPEKVPHDFLIVSWLSLDGFLNDKQSRV